MTKKKKRTYTKKMTLRDRVGLDTNYPAMPPRGAQTAFKPAENPTRPPCLLWASLEEERLLYGAAERQHLAVGTPLSPHSLLIPVFPRHARRKGGRGGGGKGGKGGRRGGGIKVKHFQRKNRRSHPSRRQRRIERGLHIFRFRGSQVGGGRGKDGVAGGGKFNPGARFSTLKVTMATKSPRFLEIAKRPTHKQSAQHISYKIPTVSDTRQHHLETPATKNSNVLRR